MGPGEREAARTPFTSVVVLAAAVSLAVGGFWWTITLRQERAAALQLIDGSQKLNIAPDGRVDQLPSLSAPLQEAVAEALRTGRFQMPAEIVALKRKVAPKSSLAVAQAPALRVLRPVGTSVADRQPTFRWVAQRDVDGYRVKVVATGTGTMISSGDLPADATEWRPEESLRADETYQWQVEAFRGPEVAARSPAASEGEARFRVLSPAQLAEFEQVKAIAGNSHLALGVAAAGAGLLDEAAAEFYALAVQNPRSEIVRQLLEQLDSNKR